MDSEALEELISTSMKANLEKAGEAMKKAPPWCEKKGSDPEACSAKQIAQLKSKLRNLERQKKEYFQSLVPRRFKIEAAANTKKRELNKAIAGLPLNSPETEARVKKIKTQLAQIEMAEKKDLDKIDEEEKAKLEDLYKQMDRISLWGRCPVALPQFLSDLNSADSSPLDPIPGTTGICAMVDEFKPSQVKTKCDPASGQCNVEIHLQDLSLVGKAGFQSLDKSHWLEAPLSVSNKKPIVINMSFAVDNDSGDLKVVQDSLRVNVPEGDVTVSVEDGEGIKGTHVRTESFRGFDQFLSAYPQIPYNIIQNHIVPKFLLPHVQEGVEEEISQLSSKSEQQNIYLPSLQEIYGQSSTLLAGEKTLKDLNSLEAALDSQGDLVRLEHFPFTQWIQANESVIEELALFQNPDIRQWWPLKAIHPQAPVVKELSFADDPSALVLVQRMMDKVSEIRKKVDARMNSPKSQGQRELRGFKERLLATSRLLEDVKKKVRLNQSKRVDVANTLNLSLKKLGYSPEKKAFQADLSMCGDYPQVSGGGRQLQPLPESCFSSFNAAFQFRRQDLNDYLKHLYDSGYFRLCAEASAVGECAKWRTLSAPPFVNIEDGQVVIVADSIDGKEAVLGSRAIGEMVAGTRSDLRLRLPVMRQMAKSYLDENSLLASSKNGIEPQYLVLGFLGPVGIAAAVGAKVGKEALHQQGLEQSKRSLVAEINDLTTNSGLLIKEIHGGEDGNTITVYADTAGDESKKFVVKNNLTAEQQKKCFPKTPANLKNQLKVAPSTGTR
ncbi:MAG: hypothetical protein H6626_00940 [Pseudobdellovibrionaceae bacterium]|nr:MAG: hypothetical protein H6626_00940 [Pseudobdellovibrionaceae bacterium]